MTPDSFLSRLYPDSQLEALLLPRVAWQPYPPIPWDAQPGPLPTPLRQALIRQGETARSAEWPQLPATLYLRYGRDGDRAAFEAPYFRRRGLLADRVLAECAQGQGRFLDAIADAAWSICEESSWCLPAHIAVQQAGVGLPDTAEPIVDLFAAETGSVLAWTHFLLAERLAGVSPLVPERIAGEIQARILTPALERDDFWWMGFGEREVNNWNPWINANWLAAALLVETDEARRRAALSKILRSLDRFIVPYPADGGCDEGPSYWTRAGGSLFDCLELLYSASGGQINVYGDPKIQNIARFIYRAHIAEDYYVNFADAPALVAPDAALVSGFGRRIGDPAMQTMGDWLAARQGSRANYGHDLTRVLRDIFQGTRDKEQGRAGTPPSYPASPPLLRDVYLPDIQFCAARDQTGTSEGLYLAAKGGHNAESHNHNDVGHFIVYQDGRPLIIDIGVETYTRKTFSPQRYEIWTMQSAYHSLPTIDGVMQTAGREFAARDATCRADDASAAFTLDLAGAYPPEAHLRTWMRTLTLERGKQVELIDAYEFTRVPAHLTLSLITPCTVELATPGTIRLVEAALAGGRVSGAGRIAYDPACFGVSVEEIPLADPRLSGAWGGRLARLLFNALRPGKQGQWLLRIAGKKR
jgi:hypothetical protein